MLRIEFDRLGGPEVLEPRRVPEPEPGPGAVRVRHRAIGVNFGDLFFLEGRYLVKPRFPDAPGMEASGVVDAVGPGVDDVAPGARVAYVGMGAFAECAVVRRNRLIPIPESMSFEQAAALPVAALTAWHLIHTVHRTAPGETVLVHSAAGGVGIAAVQIARAAGARVAGTASTPQKLEIVRRHGAEQAIDYVAGDFAAEALRWTDGRGVDLVLDAVGAPTFEKSLACLAPLGHLVLYGSAGGAPAPLDPMRLFEKCLTVSGFVVPAVYGMAALHRRALDDVFRLAREGRLEMPIGGRFPLDRAAEALESMRARGSFGKLLLVP